MRPDQRKGFATWSLGGISALALCVAIEAQKPTPKPVGTATPIVASPTPNATARPTNGSTPLYGQTFDISGQWSARISNAPDGVLAFRDGALVWATNGLPVSVEIHSPLGCGNFAFRGNIPPTPATQRSIPRV